MKHRESRAALARMKYLGTFQVRAGLATNKIGGFFSRGKDFYARERQRRPTE
jgi:hypothetical protein